MKHFLQFFVSSTVLCVLLHSCKEKTSPVCGTYRIYSKDPNVMQWVIGENTYLQINEDNTIIYNNTLNGKPKFHFTGHYILDDKTNSLQIQWAEGKLPDKMQVIRRGTDYLIQIGTTTYKKQTAARS